MTLQTLKIKDFCSTGSGGTPSRSNSSFYDGGTIPWVKSGELRENVIYDTEEYVTELALQKTSVKLVPKNAILLAMYGATVGRMAILGTEATTNQAICHILPDEKIADRGYLYHFLQYKVPALIAKAIGGAQPNINQGIIKDVVVPLPPLGEQRRITAVLDKADALRQKRRAALARLDTLLQATFLHMFGDPVTNPMGWEVVEFSQAPIRIIDGDRGKNYPKSDEFLESGHCLFLSTKNVSKRGFIFEDCQFISKEKDQILRKGKLKRHDVVLTTRGTVGNTAYYDENVLFEHIRINSGMVILRTIVTMQVQNL